MFQSWITQCEMLEIDRRIVVSPKKVPPNWQASKALAAGSLALVLGQEHRYWDKEETEEHLFRLV